MDTKKPQIWQKADVIFSVILIVLVLLLIFIIFLDYTGKEMPLTKLTEIGATVFDKQSPSDFVQEQNIRVYSDRIVIYVDNPSVSRYAATKSMDPLLDSSANGIEIPVSSIEQIHVGDIIEFEDGDSLVVHRVVKIGEDNQGWFCITKGDNSPTNDGKIRFEQIKFLTIAIIY